MFFVINIFPRFQTRGELVTKKILFNIFIQGNFILKGKNWREKSSLERLTLTQQKGFLLDIFPSKETPLLFSCQFQRFIWELIRTQNNINIITQV